jgi:phytoene dehydrogenase-like protein
MAGTNGTSPREAWDAVVVGGGHNGLVAAAYLAKAGLRTLLLEGRERLGGAADTTELAPGLRVPTLADTVGRLRPSVVRELGLRAHGLRLLGPDVRVFAPQPDG